RVPRRFAGGAGGARRHAAADPARAVVAGALGRGGAAAAGDGARRPGAVADRARALPGVRVRAGGGPRRGHRPVRRERRGRGGGGRVPRRRPPARAGAGGARGGAGGTAGRARGIVRAAARRGRAGARGRAAGGGGVSGAVVALRLRALGDVTLATAAFHSLAEGFVGRELHVVTETRFAPLLQHQPPIAPVWPLERTTWSTLQVVRALRALRPAVAIDF